MNAVRAGEIHRFGELYRRHVRVAIALAHQFQPSRDAAEDLVADAFIRVLQRLVEGAGPRHGFRPYLIATVRNVAINAAARRNRITEVTVDSSELDAAAGYVDPIPALLDSAMVTEALGMLPPRWRAVLWLSEVEGEPPARIAPMLGLTPNAVSSLTRRAKEGFRAAYLQVQRGNR